MKRLSDADDALVTDVATRVGLGQVESEDPRRWRFIDVSGLIFETVAHGPHSASNILVRPVGSAKSWSIPLAYLQQVVDEPTLVGACVLADGYAWQRDDVGDWVRVDSTHSTKWSNGPGKARAIQVIYAGHTREDTST